MATLWRLLRERRLRKFRSLRAFGEAMREAGCRRAVQASSFSPWLRQKNRERVPPDELPRLLRVLGITVGEAVDAMDGEDFAVYPELWVNQPGAGEALRSFVRERLLPSSDAEADRQVREARRLGEQSP